MIKKATAMKRKHARVQNLQPYSVACKRISELYRQTNILRCISLHWRIFFLAMIFLNWRVHARYNLYIMHACTMGYK